MRNSSHENWMRKLSMLLRTVTLVNFPHKFQFELLKYIHLTALHEGKGKLILISGCENINSFQTNHREYLKVIVLYIAHSLSISFLRMKHGGWARPGLTSHSLRSTTHDRDGSRAMFTKLRQMGFLKITHPEVIAQSCAPFWWNFFMFTKMKNYVMMLTVLTIDTVKLYARCI